jgi:hypothetical protein
MANLTQLKKHRRTDRKVTLWKGGDFTVGVSQPPRKDKLYNPLKGISSFTTFYGLKKVNYSNDEFVRSDRDPEVIEKISNAYYRAGDHQMSDRFAEAYANELTSGEYIVNRPHDLEDHGDDWGDLSDSSMGLSDATNSHKPFSTKKKFIKKSDLAKLESRKKRGSKGITAKAKRSVRSAVTIMQEKYSIYCLAFGTFTLPALRPEELEIVNLKFSDITRQLFQELTRLSERRGLDTDYVFVVEIQEKRYRAWGQFCPHIHCVMQSRKDRFSAPAIHYSEIRAIWERLLSNFLKRKVDCPAATQWEKMKRRKVGEMGKYMTKGSQIAKEAIANGDGHMLPSAWSGMSNNLKKEVKASIKILTGQDAADFIENLEVLKDAGLLSYRPIMWSPPDIDREITIGFVGWCRNLDQVFKFLAGCYESFASYIGGVCLKVA